MHDVCCLLRSQTLLRRESSSPTFTMPQISNISLSRVVKQRFCCLHVACLSSSSCAGARRYAVLGAGFAGVSVAWHLLQYASASLQINVELYDEGGIGAGASGVSGGILHPYSPRGKLVWNGLEGWTAALDLLSVAEAASKDLSEIDGMLKQNVDEEPLAWRRGIIRPAASLKHVNDFMKCVKLASDEHQRIAGLSCIDGVVASTLVPGLALSPNNLALYISQGLNIEPTRYLKALWKACKLHAKHSSTKGGLGSHAVLKETHIDSLSSLSDDYDAIIVCLGAGISRLPEFSGKLPVTFCRGVVTHLGSPPGKEDECKYVGPSIMGATWLAVQGPHKLILGATKEWDNTDTSVTVAAEAATAASNELLAKAAVFYPTIINWGQQEVRAGVRVMTPRTPWGKVPLVGCIDDLIGRIQHERAPKMCSPHYWIFGGLGSRGLIYHAWLGRKVAEAVVSQSEACLPREFLQWKHESDRIF